MPHSADADFRSTRCRSTTARWQRFLAENDLPWTNVLSPGCGKQSPAAAMYGIRFIPSNFLISPDGVIVARNLPGRQLQSRLEELMK